MHVKYFRKEITRLTPILLVTAIALGITVPGTAQSTAELLEKGIYTEQTVGDLAAAIEIYTQVVQDGKANRPHVAQAQFRLAMCYLKKGNEAKARVALEQLIEEYPGQKQLVAQAREQLAAVQPALAVASAPWEDGEFLRYRMSLPTGKVMGSILLKAESTVVDGVEAWQLEMRRFVGNNADNYGISRVLVDRHTQRPIRATFRHGALGNADTTYGPDGATVTSGEKVTQVDSDSEIYDNDQAMHLMRTLPLKPGYEVQLNLLPTWMAQLTETTLQVTGQESCRVPAGEFDCYSVVLDTGESYWLSTDSGRYPVKIEGGGIVIELAEIGNAQPGDPVAFGLEDFGFSGTLPTDWWFHEHRFVDRPTKAMLRLLDPDAASISAVEIDRCPASGCPSLLQSSQRELAGAEQRFDDYKLRSGSWSERTLGGRPAISFVGDYTRDGKPWVQYRLYTFVNAVRLEFIFRTPVGRFEQLRATFDAVAESIHAE